MRLPIPIAAATLAALAGCAHQPSGPATSAAQPAAATAAPARPKPTSFPLTPLGAMEAVHVTNPHDHQGKPYCARCHPNSDPSVRADPIGLCAQCHPPSLMKHPFGVVPARAPADLPLGPERKIVCHTCHDPHDVKAHRKGLRLDYMPLCAQCHAGHGAKPRPPAK